MWKPTYSFPLSARLLIALLSFAILQPFTAQSNPLAAAASLAGTYTDGVFTLVLTGKPGAYSGSLTLQGNTFPVTAAGQGSALRGTFSANGRDLPFTAQWNGSELLLDSAGNRFSLRRETPPAPSAPAGQPTQAGQFQFRLPAGWTVKADPGGDVALLPPGFNPQSVTELYMLAAPGCDSLRDPEILQDLEEDFIPEAARRAAQKNTTALQVPGRQGLVHTWKFQRPDNGQAITVAAYLVESSGQVLQILATAAGDLPPARHQELQQIAASLQIASAQQPAPAPLPQATTNTGAARTGIQTHPRPLPSSPANSPTITPSPSSGSTTCAAKC